MHSHQREPPNTDFKMLSGRCQNPRFFWGILGSGRNFLGTAEIGTSSPFALYTHMIE